MKTFLCYQITLLKYHFELSSRKFSALFLPKTSYKDLGSYPPITLFISSLNTRYPLELTIKSLIKNTQYPNIRLLIGENASTDGSATYVESLDLGNIPIEIIRSSKPRLHSDWLNEVANSIETPYWFSIHSDMLFYSGDWIVDMMKYMESQPDIYLLSAEKQPDAKVCIEPVSHQKVLPHEQLCTWLLCMRTSYRDKMHTSFDFVKEDPDPHTGVIPIYDTGEKLLEDMKKSGLRCEYMPKWFMKRYYHFGNLSYAFDVRKKGYYQKFKAYQMMSIQKMIGQF
jgi:Glycosyl transferase family 2